MLFVVISAAFVGLAILLDRLFPFGLIPSRRWRAEPIPEGAAGAVETEPELQTSRSGQA
jgi:hypothetical protein